MKNQGDGLAAPGRIAHQRLWVLALLSLIVLGGCGFLVDPNTGTLYLSLSPRLVLQTIEPDLNMTPAYYDVFGTRPGSASFEQLDHNSTTVVQASLIPGDWTIVVEAYNNDTSPTKIGEGLLIPKLSDSYL